MVAILIIDSERVRGEFDMFGLRSIDETGAVLEGPCFLEVGEQLTLRLGSTSDSLEVQARVLSVLAEEECMKVIFREPDPRLKSLLAERKASA